MGKAGPRPLTSAQFEARFWARVDRDDVRTFLDVEKAS